MSIYSIMAFNAAHDQVQKNVQDSQAIEAKKVQTQTAQEELDLNKKLDVAKTKQARNEGMMSDYVGNALEEQINKKYKAKQEQLDAVSGLQDIAQHKAQQQAQQAAQIASKLHAQDPDVQAHVSTLTGIMNAQGGQSQSPQMSMAEESNQGAKPQLPSIPGIAPVQGGASPQNVDNQVVPQIGAPSSNAQPDTTEAVPQSQQTPQQIPQGQQQGIDLSPVEQAFGMPKGSMWLNPATMKPEINPIWKSKVERQQAAQATYDVNQPFREQQREDRNVKTAESYLVNSIKQKGSPVGVQDNKVNAAIHARELISQAYDPATGNYNVTQVPYAELSESVGNLLSGGTGSSEGRINALKQKTAQGDINAALSYITGKPSNATSQDAIKQLVSIIDRQGEVSEDLRDKAIEKMKGLPTFSRLNDEDFQALKQQHLGNSFKEVLDNAPDRQASKNIFISESDAEKANLPSGTLVTINGRRAKVK